MKTIMIQLVVLLFSLNLYAQDFTRFNERKVKVSDLFLSIVPKEVKDFSPGAGVGIRVDNHLAFMKQATHDFFEVFTQIAPEDEQRYDRMKVYLHVVDTLLNTDYIEFHFLKKDRDYVLKNEELFYQFARTFKNMGAYREYVYFEECAPGGGGHLDFPFKSFFKIKAGTFWK